jgi:hypothetical protein
VEADAISINPKYDKYLSYFRSSCYGGRIGREHFARNILVKKPCANGAKRNEGQTIENTQFREIVDSAALMISKTCDPCRETFHFAERNEALRFRCFGLLGERKRNTLELA